jgi:hypothetical protein
MLAAMIWHRLPESPRKGAFSHYYASASKQTPAFDLIVASTSIFHKYNFGSGLRCERPSGLPTYSYFCLNESKSSHTGSSISFWPILTTTDRRPPLTICYDNMAHDICLIVCLTKHSCCCAKTQTSIHPSLTSNLAIARHQKTLSCFHSSVLQKHDFCLRC